MSAEAFLSSSLWRLISWLPGIFLRFIFSADVLAKLTKLEIKSRNEAITVYCGEMPYVRIWLEIRNRSPFAIELDRLTAYVTINATICTILYLDRTTIHPSSDMEIEIRGDMTAPQAYQLLSLIKRENLPGNPAYRNGSLSINADFNCRISNFSIRNRVLDGINYRVSNPHLAPITDIENRLKAIEVKLEGPGPKS